MKPLLEKGEDKNGKGNEDFFSNDCFGVNMSGRNMDLD